MGIQAICAARQARTSLSSSPTIALLAALKAATINNATLIRQEKNLGTIEPGKLADLILVDGDPLKDIAVLQKYETHITLIMQNGALYKNTL